MTLILQEVAESAEIQTLNSQPSTLNSAASAASCSKEAFSFGVPAEDKRYFCETLPHEERAQVTTLLEYCRLIHGARNKAQETRRLAGLPRNQGRGGYSVSTLTRKYYDYCNSGGSWRELINGSKVKAAGAGDKLPAQFVSWFQGLCESNQRHCSGAIVEVWQIWRTHFSSDGRREFKAIPGYAQWPEAEATTGLPAGWTERNLYRQRPDDYALALGRVGRVAASEHRLKVFKTRVGLRLCEFVQFDDHEYNVKVNFPRQWRAMRPRGFSAIDVLSGCPFAKSFKPTLWDDLNEKKQALTERDMMWFVVHVLTDFGFRGDERGTALCVEWGTAAIREAFEKRIHEATGGKVRVERSGKFHAESLRTATNPRGNPTLSVASQFRGAVKGNFRFKALIESFWALIDTRLAGMPGQVGKDRNHAPEQITGADRYNEKLLALEAVLPPSVAGQLRKPFYSWQEFLDLALACYQAIERADRHELEGWEKLGFEAKEWRLQEGSEWLEYEKLLALPDTARAVAETLVMENPLLRRVRRMSRGEVFTAHRKELTPLGAWEFPTLMGEENAVRAGEAMAAKAGIFQFESGGEEFKFVAEDEFGGALRDKYVCYVNPFSPSVLVACDARGRVKALCRPAIVSCHNDRESLHRAMGEARKAEARDIHAYEARHAGEIKRKKEMHEHNARVIAGAGAPVLASETVATVDSTDELLAEG